MAKTEEHTAATNKKSNSKLVVIIVLVAAVLIGLGLLGRYLARKVAQKAASSFISGMTGQKVDVGGDGKNITIKTDQGEVNINSGGTIPANFPKDFPVYPGAKVTGSFSANGDDSSKGTSVVWTTGDDPAKVGTFYKSELVKAGYTIVTEYSQADSTSLTFEKGTTSGFMAVAKGDNNQTTISVTVGLK